LKLLPGAEFAVSQAPGRPAWWSLRWRATRRVGATCASSSPRRAAAGLGGGVYKKRLNGKQASGMALKLLAVVQKNGT